MVIGVNRLGFVIQRIAEDLIGTVGNHLIDIHVMAGAGPSLKRVYNKLVIMLERQHFIRGSDNRKRKLVIQQAKVFMHLSRGTFDNRHTPDKSRPWSEAANREIFYCTLSLCGIERIFGNFY